MMMRKAEPSALVPNEKAFFAVPVPKQVQPWHSIDIILLGCTGIGIAGTALHARNARKRSSHRRLTSGFGTPTTYENFLTN